jgi:hypothetical protein
MEHVDVLRKPFHLLEVARSVRRLLDANLA